jgi:hypothetical protein
MSTNQRINKKISIIIILLTSSGLWFYSAFAQDANFSLGLEKTGLPERLSAFDHLLNIGVVAPLTALSLTGATFLTRSSKSENENPKYTHLIDQAKKNLIKAFVIFLSCTIAVFVFDFIELLATKYIVTLEIFDLVITYALLFSGFGYLAVAERCISLKQNRVLEQNHYSSSMHEPYTVEYTGTLQIDGIFSEILLN